MKAIILASGTGKGLMPLTAVFPKSLAPVCLKPCIHHTLDLLKKHGFDDVFATLRQGSEKIKSQCAGKDITFVKEQEPLGTAGSVKKCQKHISGDFLVISGDSITDFDLGAAMAFHKGHGAVATVILSEVSSPLDYGVCITDKEGKITDFIENPSFERAYSATVNTGIYIFSSEIFSYIKEDTYQGFAEDVFPRLLRDKKDIFGYCPRGYWNDVSSVRSYLQCNKDVLSGKVGVELTENGTAEGAVIHPPCRIGKNVVAQGAEIGPYSVIGDNCVIGSGSRIEGSVLFDGVCVSEDCNVRKSVLCNGAVLKKGVSVCDFASVGADCVIGKNSVVGVGVGISPENMIKEDSILTRSVTGEFAPFDFEKSRSGVKGDISLFSRLGAAFGSLFRGNIAVGYSDTSDSALLHTLSGGILSTGDNVLNLGCCEKNELRYTLRAYGLSGGVYVSSEGLYFYDSDGLFLRSADEKAFLHVFEVNEFECNSCGSYRTLKDYRQSYLKKLKKSAVCVKPLNVLIYGDLNLMKVIPVKQNEGAEHFYVSDVLTVDEYPERITKCCIAIAFGMTFGYVCIPYSYPRMIDKLSAQFGFTVIRLSYDSEQRARLYDITDANICTCVLCSYLSRTKQTFADLADSIPTFDILSREVDCDKDKYSIMKRLYGEEDNSRELVEGIRFTDGDKNWSVRVLPKNDAYGFRIIAEAFSSETAEEMCDFYVKKIRSDNIFIDNKE